MVFILILILIIFFIILFLNVKKNIEHFSSWYAWSTWRYPKSWKFDLMKHARPRAEEVDPTMNWCSTSCNNPNPATQVDTTEKPFGQGCYTNNYVENLFYLVYWNDLEMDKILKRMKTIHERMYTQRQTWETTNNDHPLHKAITNEKMQANLDLKADKTDLTKNLGLEALTDFKLKLNAKVDKKYGNTELNNYIDTIDVTTTLKAKADKKYVEQELNNYTNKTAVDDLIQNKRLASPPALYSDSFDYDLYLINLSHLPITGSTHQYLPFFSNNLKEILSDTTSNTGIRFNNLADREDLDKVLKARDTWYQTQREDFDSKANKDDVDYELKQKVDSNEVDDALNDKKGQQDVKKAFAKMREEEVIKVKSSIYTLNDRFTSLNNDIIKKTDFNGSIKLSGLKVKCADLNNCPKYIKQLFPSPTSRSINNDRLLENIKKIIQIPKSNIDLNP